MQPPRSLLGGGVVLVALCGVSTLALASPRLTAGHAASNAPVAGRCVPSALNHSAVLPGTGLAVSPLPDSYDASPSTQISLLGAPLSALNGVRVSGSQSGSHGGREVGYSQGDGASFVPSSPFRPGETVTVRGKVRSGSAAQPFAFRFVVAEQDSTAYLARAVPARDSNEMQHFPSRPELQPPVEVVTAHSPQAAPGYLFTTPYAGPGPSGPTIFDDSGNLVWFDPLPRGTEAANLQVQQYGGAPVLTWWQGRITPQGFGVGEEMIDDGSYRQIRRVRAGNGYQADLHDFQLTPQGTALLTVLHPIACDLSAVGGPAVGALTDSIFQELDLPTGLVRREWHSVDHVALADSYSSPTSASSRWPFDYFHLNSIDQLAGAPASAPTTLISARNTSALYELDTLTGQVRTVIGGRHSSVKLASGAATAYQHDATAQTNGTITLFDNGAVPTVHPQSRALVVAVNPQARTDTVVAQYEHPAPLSAGSQGNVQALANGDLVVGWGSAPYVSEFSATGQLLFDAHMHGSYQSYRSYRFSWSGAPSEPPAVAAVAAPAAGGSAGAGAAPVTVYASWNGDTRTASWRVLAGPSAQQLAPVAGAARTGFETAISTPGPAPFLAVQALDASGAVLGTSRTIPG
jgi:hypothetical protein